MEEREVVIKEVKEISLLTRALSLAKNYILKEDKYENHILILHGARSKNLYKSRFLEYIDIKSAIDDALKSSNSLIKMNTADDSGKFRPGFIFEKRYPNQIGVGSDGKELFAIEVVLTEKGEVATAYPTGKKLHI